MKKISQFILKSTGWKSIFNVEKPAKSVICVAPHTSNWDFIIGKLFAWSVGLNAGFLMKKSWFFFPMGYLFRAMDGIPIDRTKKSSVVQQMIDEFNQHKEMHLAITPEGTRKRNDQWKLGFYHIAKGANVPIMLAYINFSKKKWALPKIFTPLKMKRKI